MTSSHTTAASLVPNFAYLTGFDPTPLVGRFGLQDSASLSAQQSGNNADGSQYNWETYSEGTPTGHSLSLDLAVPAQDLLTMTTLTAGEAIEPELSFELADHGHRAGQLVQGGNHPVSQISALQIPGVGSWTVTNLTIPQNVIEYGIQFGYATSRLTLNAEVESGNTMSMKVPAGTYASGAITTTNYAQFVNGNFVSGSLPPAPIAGEVGVGDTLVDTTASPTLLHRTPVAGTFCAKPGEHDSCNDDGGRVVHNC